MEKSRVRSVVLTEVMAASGVRFGTSGARGRVVDLTAEVCYAYTAAFLQVAAGGAQRVAVGHDLRPSSPAMTQACLAAIRDSGREAIYCGALPTPALAYYGQQQRLPVVVVTGSHIPFDRNGIKFYRAEGEITKADEQAIGAAVVAVPDPLELPPLPPIEGAALQLYRQRYLDLVPADLLRGRRIALYEHSSVARDLLRELLEQLGAEVISLGRTDHFVPVDTEAVSAEDGARARQWAQQHRFDAIFSTDGDGDRPLIGDETGQWLRGDVVGILTARYLGATHVVTPVSSNSAVERCGEFQQVIRTPIGSPFVIAAMERLLAELPSAVVVGYEANGGFLLGSRVVKGGQVLEPLPTRDAVLPCLALLALAHEQQIPLSQLTATLPPRYTASDRRPETPTEASRQLLQQLQQQPQQCGAVLLGEAERAVRAVDTTDGLRLTFDGELTIHLRPSGNAPELRCYVESETPESAAQWCRQVLERVGQRLSSTLG